MHLNKNNELFIFKVLYVSLPKSILHFILINIVKKYFGLLPTAITLQNSCPDIGAILLRKEIVKVQKSFSPTQCSHLTIYQTEISNLVKNVAKISL